MNAYLLRSILVKGYIGFIILSFSACTKEITKEKVVIENCNNLAYYPVTNTSYWSYVQTTDSSGVINYFVEKYIILDDTSIGGITFKNRKIEKFTKNNYPDGRPIVNLKSYDNSLLLVQDNKVYYYKFRESNIFYPATLYVSMDLCAELGEKIEAINTITDNNLLQGTFKIVTELSEESSSIIVNSKTYSDIRKYTVSYYRLTQSVDGKEQLDFYLKETLYLSRGIGIVRFENSLVPNVYNDLVDFSVK